ncbi:MAG TPA: hypothetical protein VI757_11775 [Bacteroidia bacterium]|nr:hypothetical protein [Bacteroidia bacterium]
MKARPIYRHSSGQRLYWKINPSGSIIEVEFFGMGYDVSISMTRNSKTISREDAPAITKSEFAPAITKSEFDTALRRALDIIRACNKGNAQIVEIILKAIKS